VSEKEWRIPLVGDSYLAVYVVRLNRRIINFAVVLIERGECVTRYDCAHGTPHRDVLGKKSVLIRKEVCENMTNEEAFEYAIADLKTNCERYAAYYESH
jgi:hypothetical protein